MSSAALGGQDGSPWGLQLRCPMGATVGKGWHPALKRGSCRIPIDVITGKNPGTVPRGGLRERCILFMAL